MPKQDDWDRQENSIINAIYAAALGDASWHDVLSRCSIAFPFAKFTLMSFDCRLSTAPASYYVNWEESYVKSYHQHYAAINAWNNTLIHKTPWKVAWGAEFIDDKKLAATEYFNEWLRPQDSVSHAIGIKLFTDADRTFVLSSNFNPKHDNPAERLFKGAEKLYPHLLRAFEMQRRLEGMELRAWTVERALDSLSCAVFVVDRAANVILFNSRGEALAKAGEVLSVDLSRRLKFRSVADQTAVADEIHRATHGLESDGGVFVQLRGATTRRLVAFVAPLIFQDVERPWSTLNQRERGRYLIFVIDLDDEPKSSEQQVIEALGVSAAEARLAIAFARGATLQEYADEAQLSYNTVRTQMKSLMAKTGRNRQAMLMRDVARILSVNRKSDEAG